MSTPEKEIENSIIDHLRKKRFFTFRVHNVTQFDPHINAYRKPGKGYVPGVSDLIAMKDKRIVFLEVKTPQGSQDPNQKLFEDRVRDEGFEYYVVRSIEDVDNLLA
jgi:hypothetical protein